MPQCEPICGVSELVKDQTVDGGRWNLLGSYAMTPGQNHRVEAIHLDAGNRLIADALRIEPAAAARQSSANWASGRAPPPALGRKHLRARSEACAAGCSEKSDCR